MRLISGVVRYNNIALVKSTTLVMALPFDTKPDSLSLALSLSLSLSLSLTLCVGWWWWCACGGGFRMGSAVCTDGGAGGGCREEV